MSTRYKGTVDEVRALNAFIKFTRAADTIASRLNAVVASHGLTGSQFGTMETLYHLGPMCPGEIAQKLLKSSGNVTLVIDNLEKRGFVQREVDLEDRRQVIVSLTAEGEEMIARIFPRHVRYIQEQLSILTPDEQDELGRLCKTLGTQTRP